MPAQVVVIQPTQGMPFFAVTAPPWAPAVGMGTAELEAVGVRRGHRGVRPGTVAFEPSMTWTCPAATVELAVAETPNSEAIWLALAAEPVPYSTSVVLSALVFAICPALYPSFTRAVETCPASPGVLPPL